MVICITGTNGSGKGAVVQYLTSKGFVHHSVRTRLEGLLKADHSVVDRSTLRDIANRLRKEHGADYLARLIYEDIQFGGEEDAVIESVRTVSEATYLKAQEGIILAIDADRKTRYERIKRRGSGTDKIDFETFVKEEEREWYGAEGAHDMNLMDVMKMADKTIVNDGTLSELYAKIDAVVESLKEKS